MRFDPRYGLILTVPAPVFILWHAMRAAPAVLVATLWIVTAYRFLT
jgi:hypothetical protein